MHTVELSRPYMHTVELSRPYMHTVALSRPYMHMVELSRPYMHTVELSRLYNRKATQKLKAEMLKCSNAQSNAFAHYKRFSIGS